MTATPDLAGPATHEDPKTQRMHPAFEAVAAKRAASAQLRIADAITAFAGSMKFVYLHAVAVRRVDGRLRAEPRGRR